MIGPLNTGAACVPVALFFRRARAVFGLIDIYKCSGVKDAMHIAHKTDPPPLSAKAVAKLAGLKMRQLANLASAGEIPGVLRAANGYHFSYPDTPALRVWASRKRRLAKERAQSLPATASYYYPRADVDLQRPRQLATAFHEWKTWMRANDPFHGWEDARLRALSNELATFREASERIAKLLKQRSDARLRARKAAVLRRK